MDDQLVDHLRMDIEIHLDELEVELNELVALRYEARRLFSRDARRRLRELQTERERLLEVLEGQ